MNKRFINLCLSLLMVIGVINPEVVFAESVGFNVSVIWNDNDNKNGFRPNDVDYSVVSNGTVKLSDNVSEEEMWSDDIELDSSWGSVSLSFPKLEGYSSFGRLYGNSYVQTYTSLYNDVSDKLYIDTIWNDNNDSAGARPASYSLTVKDSFGVTKTYTIGKAQTQYVSEDFVFSKDGKVNALSATAGSISKYSTDVSVDSSAVTGLHITVTNTYSGSDALSAGLQTISYAGETLHVYKMSGKEKIALLSSTDTGDPGGAINIANFTLSGKRIKAIVNASYFNNTSDVSVYGQIYGRAQGFSMGSNGYIDARTGGPQDDWAAAELARYGGSKPYMDLVIDKNNNVHAGDFNSWDYPLSDITLGVAPAVIEILNGTTHEYYSPAVGTGKMTTKNTQTGLAKTADGSWALFTVENGNGGLSPRVGIKNFGNAYGFSELSVYDSGGSTQMIVNGSKIQYTGRKIPDVLVIYEDSSVSYKTVTVKFSDNGSILNNYTIVKTFEEGKTANTNIDETVNLLYNAGYDMADNSWMDYRTVDGSVTSITIPVTHRKETVVSQTEKQYTRTVKFVDKNGTTLKPALKQTLTAVTLGSGEKDLVTGNVTYDGSEKEYWNNGSAYPEITPEPIEGYKTPENVPEDDIAWKEENARSYTVTVVYEEAVSETHKVSFEDRNEDKQNLDLYTTTYEIKDGRGVTVDVSDKVSALKNKGYVIKDEDIPTTILDKDIVIPVDHTVVLRQADYPDESVTYTRKIRFIDINGNEMLPDVIDQIVREKHASYRKDMVTGREFDFEYSYTWSKDSFDAYVVPEIDDYYRSVETIDKLNVYDDMETEIVETVVYTAKETVHLDINTNEPVEINVGAHSGDERNFRGWAYEPNGEIISPAYQKFTVSSDTDLYAVFSDEEELRALDVNARLNGKYIGNTSGIASFDVLIDGALVKESATDFYKKYPVGTEFEITNITPAEGYVFTGVSSAKSYSGVYPAGVLHGKIVGSMTTDVALSFITEDYTGTAGNVAKTNFVPNVSTAEINGAETYTVNPRQDTNTAFAGWDENNNAQFAPMNYLDINAKVNGKYRGNVSGIGTFDVYINDEMAARMVTDYYWKWPAGTRYRIVLHKTDDTLDFTGVSETASRGYIPGGSLEGVVGSDKTEVLLMFEGSLPKLTLVSEEETVTTRHEPGSLVTLKDPFNLPDAIILGWAEEPYGEIVYNNGDEIEISEDTTLYAIFREASYLDVNGVVDGVYVGNLKDVATFDVEIAGEKVSEGVYDFWSKVPVGSGVFIRNIKPKEGYRLVKVTTKNVIDITFGKYPQAFVIGPGVRNEVYLRFETGDTVNLTGDAYEDVEEEVFWDGENLIFVPEEDSEAVVEEVVIPDEEVSEVVEGENPEGIPEDVPSEGILEEEIPVEEVVEGAAEGETEEIEESEG